MSSKGYKSFDELWDIVEDSDEFAISEAILDFTIELENLVKKRGFSRAELAKKTGKSQPYITKIFRGETNFTIGTMVKLVRAISGKISLHVTPAEEGDINWLRRLDGGKPLLSAKGNNKADQWFEEVGEEPAPQEMKHVSNGGFYEYPITS